MPVINPKALTRPVVLWVLELIKELNGLYKVGGHASHHLHKVVFIEVIGDPEGNVFVTSWVFAVRFELSDFTLFELLQKPFVLTPEQADVSDFKKFHGPTFQS